MICQCITINIDLLSLSYAINMLTNIHGHPRGGGQSRRSPTVPPWKKIYIFRYIWGHFATFSSCGSLFTTFFSLWGVFFTMWGPYRQFFLHVGGLLSLWEGLSSACPPPLPKFLRVPILTSLPYDLHSYELYTSAVRLM